MKIREAVASVTLLFELFIIFFLISSEVRIRRAEYQNRAERRKNSTLLFEYDAFGNTISCKEQVENRFRYQDEQYDPITRQYYLRARYYNPVIGRFIQEDTYYGDGLNLYEYCRNNAITYKDPTGHNICPTQRDLYHKYKEEGMSLQEAYQKMRKELGLDSKSGYKDSGVGNGKDPWRSYESGRNTATTINYSYKFDRELANFNDGYEIRTTVDKDLILVQYSSDAPDASLCYWTTVDEANRITTLNDYMDKLALSKDWGNRNTVKVARIPAGIEVKYAVGTAREQLLIADPRPGGGVQYLFNQFDTDWITEIRSFSN